MLLMDNAADNVTAQHMCKIMIFHTVEREFKNKYKQTEENR